MGNFAGPNRVSDYQDIGLRDNPELAIGLLKSQLDQLVPIQEKIENTSSYDEKYAYVSSLAHVEDFFRHNPLLETELSAFPVQYRYVVKLVVALGQGPVLFSGWENVENRSQRLKELIDTLFTQERFYDYMGGIAGYHVKTLQLFIQQLAKKKEPDQSSKAIRCSSSRRKNTMQ